MKDKAYIIRRIVDGNHLVVSERELKDVLIREHWTGTNFVKDFELVGEDKSNDVDMEELFGK